MSNIVIKAENISKQYRLGEVGTGSIAHDLNVFWHRLRGKENPYLKIGEANDRTTKGSSEYVWALQDINFEVNRGEVLGIIGRNGAGKSTLLKILSKTTAPTTGSIKIKGRIASLLEVGTGFHPDLSGRENIFLNGAILGMTKKEIKSKFDEIVDFAGIERYIDTPVKRYSSGMYVRLAFAVAAHLEPDILIVDEVLAVGDAEFQKKCLGKMKDVSVNDGRTVLFVSHNIGSIYQLCTKGLLMKNGFVQAFGNIDEVIDMYTQRDQISTVYKIEDNAVAKNKKAFFSEVYLTDENNELKTEYKFIDNIYVVTKFKINNFIPNTKISLTIQNKNGDYLSTLVEDLSDLNINDSGNFTLSIKLQNNIIAPNSYYLRVALFIMNGEVFDLLEMITPFKVFDTGTNLLKLEGYDYGHYFIKYEITT